MYTHILYGTHTCRSTTQRAYTRPAKWCPQFPGRIDNPCKQRAGRCIATTPMHTAWVISASLRTTLGGTLPWESRQNQVRALGNQDFWRASAPTTASGELSVCVGISNSLRCLFLSFPPPFPSYLVTHFAHTVQHVQGVLLSLLCFWGCCRSTSQRYPRYVLRGVLLDGLLQPLGAPRRRMRDHRQGLFPAILDCC